MGKKVLIITAAITILLILGFSNTASSEEVNILKNPGFEEVSGTLPVGWYTDAYKNTADAVEFFVEESTDGSGSKYCTINNIKPNDSRFRQEVKVIPGSVYKISYLLKVDSIEPGGGGANITFVNGIYYSNFIFDTGGSWQKFEHYIRTHKDGEDTLTFWLRLGGFGSEAKGKVSFDDVSIELVENPDPGIKIEDCFLPNKNSEFASSNEGHKTGSNGSGSDKSLIYVLVGLAAIGLLIFFESKLVKKSKGKSESGTVVEDYEYIDENSKESISHLTTEGDNLKEKKQAASLKRNIKGQFAPKPTATPTTKLILDKRDILLMIIMTVVYLAAALINLGSLSAPETSWRPSAAGESFELNLGHNASISRIYYNCGTGSGAFRLEYYDDSGKLQPLVNINPNNFDDFYKWRYLNIQANANLIKITVDTPGAALNELGIFESGSDVPLKDVKIENINTNPNDKGSVLSLFDEQQTIPYRPSFMNSTYFDEIYHARTAYEHLNRIEPYESTHPPLGKILISLGILIFGMNPFGWRIIGTLFGAAMIPAMYVFAKKMFQKRFYAFLAAFLIMFDFMHFSLTRIATIDVYVTFFVILMFYYMYDCYINKSYVLGYKKSLKPLFLCGLFFGLGAASKWIALYGAVGLALLFILTKYEEYKDYSNALKSRKTKKLPWINEFFPLYIRGTALYCILFFIIIPGIIYLLSYIPFMMVPGPGHNLRSVFSYQAHMYSYHKNLTATHSFSSKWWEWPLMVKPLWAYSGSDPAQGKTSTIVFLGNPAIWWPGIAAVITSIFLAFKYKDKKIIAMLVAIAAQYLPWVLVPRIAFIYHYFSIIPFVILIMVYLIKHIMEKYPNAKYLVYGYLVVTAILFIWFYPALSGMEVSSSYISNLKWLKSWIF